MEKNPVPESRSSVQTLDRTFDILETLSSRPRGASLTELSRTLSLHKSTVFRLLSALQNRRYVEKQGTTYRLGLEFIHIASQYLNSLELKTEAEPLLRALSGSTGLTVFLATRDQEEVVYIDKIGQYDSLRRYSVIGTRLPLYCTSLGRAFLMAESPAELNRTLAGLNLLPRTAHTVTSRENLAKMVAEFRHRGWSEDIQENQEGVRCVGAPVFDYRTKPIAAVSAVWNVDQEETDPRKIGEAVLRTAVEISERLGCLSYPGAGA